MQTSLRNVLLATTLAACAAGPTKPAPVSPTTAVATTASGNPAAIHEAVSAADRSDDDRKLDAGRKPEAVLGFFRIAPGQRVAELFAGGGYTSELLARVVGDHGAVYAQNTTAVLDKFARKPWSERAAKPVMAHVVGVERELDDPLPADATGLDAVVCVLNYHDAVWIKADRAKMNRAVFAALRPGGVYGIVDHSAKKGSGAADAETLHRIDEDLVIAEVTAAGFKLDGESDALRNPDDQRDWNSSPRAAGERRGTSDRFVLRFVRP